MAKAKAVAPAVVAPAKVKKSKINCDCCGEPTASAELYFNEAEHGHNVCDSCGELFQKKVVEDKIALLVKKGTAVKVATKKVNGMDLESSVLKTVLKYIEEENPEDDEVEDIELTSLVDDDEVDLDEDELELDEEVASRKPVGKAKTAKKEKAEPAKPATPVAPVKKSKKEKAEPVKALSPRQQRLADRAARKAAKEAAAVTPVKSSKKEKVAEGKATKTPAKAAATPVKEMSARQIRLAERAARKAAKSAGVAPTKAPVAPAKKEQKGLKPAVATKVKDFSVVITMEQARVEKFVRLAIKEVAEEMTHMKIKTGVNVAELKINMITTAFETRLGNAFVKDFKAAAKESGCAKDIKALIASA